MQSTTITIANTQVTISRMLIHLASEWIDLAEKDKARHMEDAARILSRPSRPRLTLTPEQIAETKRMNQLSSDMWLQLVVDNPHLDYRPTNPVRDIFSPDHNKGAFAAAEIADRAKHRLFLRLALEKAIPDFHSPYDPTTEGIGDSPRVPLIRKQATAAADWWAQHLPPTTPATQRLLFRDALADSIIDLPTQTTQGQKPGRTLTAREVTAAAAEAGIDLANTSLPAGDMLIATDGKIHVNNEVFQADFRGRRLG